MKPDTLDLVRQLKATLEGMAKTSSRLVVAITGPPGAGKSTLSDVLVKALNQDLIDEPAVVLPMDGFHLDNCLLDLKQTRHQKGAPHTFDVSGFKKILKRVATSSEDIFVPVFDRSLDIARAGARVISKSHKIVIVEGNYLLLDQPLWSELNTFFDYRIYLDVEESELTRRLVKRWLDHGLDDDAALARAESNDLPNARLVASCRLSADKIVS